MVLQRPFIPVNEPYIGSLEKELVNDCLNTGWISSEGPLVSQFEEKLAHRFNRRYAIAVSSGTAALDIAISALKLSPGDEIILPTFTIISCVHQILRSGLVPVFIDADPVTWNIDVTLIEQHITPKTRAILAVHIYGLTSDLSPLQHLCRSNNLFLIEDAAESIGQLYKTEPCGSFGDLSTFSFYPNKHVTTGEGGAVLTDNSNIAELCYSLRNLCFQPEQRFVHQDLGWNYRMTNIQAALGIGQLSRLDSTLNKKRHIGLLYRQLLSQSPLLSFQPDMTPYTSHQYWVFSFLLNPDCSLSPKQLSDKLIQFGIGSRPFFCPLHLQPVLSQFNIPVSPSLPVSERLYKRGIYIPSGVTLSDDDIHYVAESLLEILSLYSQL